MNQLTQSDRVSRISSRRVAELIEICSHKNLIRKIEKINEDLTGSKLSPLDYWLESSYVDSKGENRKEYLVSEKGCTFLAHKTTGTKGTLFTARYMEEFDKMKAELQGEVPSYQIVDPIERAKAWIAEEEQRQLLQHTVEEQKEEIFHKEDVIVGLVDDIDLASKRQRITQIVRFRSKSWSKRYNLLYSEFNKKYHLDVERRLQNAKDRGEVNKSMNTMAYICEVMGKTAELYDLACKIFENDVKILLEEWSSTIERKSN